MALPDIVRGTYIDILIGNGASPEVFTPICGLTTRSFTAQANSSDHFIADCADPESVPIRRLIITGQQWSLSGDGRYNRSQGALLRAAHGVVKNYRFVVSEPEGDDIEDGYFFGAAALLNLQIGGSSGEAGEFGTVSLQIESDGEWAWSAAA